MNIVLTGFMASGKSTVAKELSKITGREFFDTDAMVVENAGMEISGIFDSFGEEHFRRLEKEAVLAVSAMDGVIIATGGGAVVDCENMENLKKNGVIINLSPEPDVILKRLREDTTRPLARNTEAVLSLFESRKDCYSDCDLQVTVTEDSEVAGLCEEILGFLGGRL